MLDNNFYNTVLCQAFSPCGKYLFAGDIYGGISIFDLNKIINPDETATSDRFKPKLKLQVTTANSMVTTQKFLICGSVGEISGWNWKSLLSPTKHLKPAWTLTLPGSKDIMEKTEVNCMWYDDKSGLLYAGCGDNCIHIFSLEDGRLIRTMDGHEDYIHSIHNQGSQMVSASEDGFVKIWDLRDKQVTNKIKPSQEEKINRPHLGKWVGAAALSENWLLCGGGPKLSLWHLHSLDVTTVFEMNDSGVHCAEFFEDRILAGGEAPFFYQFNYNSDIFAEIPSSSICVYSAIHQQEPNKALCIAGSSPKIDLCTNFSYRDQVLSLY